MTKLELIIVLILVIATSFVVSAIGIEIACDMPARKCLGL